MGTGIHPFDILVIFHQFNSQTQHSQFEKNVGIETRIKNHEGNGGWGPCVTRMKEQRKKEKTRKTMKGTIQGMQSAPGGDGRGRAVEEGVGFVRFEGWRGVVASRHSCRMRGPKKAAFEDWGWGREPPGHGLGYTLWGGGIPGDPKVGVPQKKLKGVSKIPGPPSPRWSPEVKEARCEFSWRRVATQNYTQMVKKNLEGQTIGFVGEES